MIEKIKRYLLGSVFRKGASLLTFLTLGSYVLGLARDMLFAHFFGASRMLDIYNAAFIIPDLILNIFVASALSAAFIPMFTHLYASGEEDEADKVATTMLYAAPVTMLFLAIPAFIFMPQLSSWVAPGFSGQEKDLLILMSRLMLLSPIIFAVSNTLGNILVSYEKFFGYGLSPVLYNLGIIAGIPLTAAMGPFGLIVGTLCGAFLHLLVRVVAIFESRFRQKFPVDIRDKNFLKILKLMLPRMAGQPVEQITFFVFTSMASTLAAGSIAVLNFARNFESVPVSIFGISFATVIFSSLSKKAALKDREGFLRHLKETSKALALVSIVSALFYIFFGQFVIRIFLGGGRFTNADVIRTAQVLAILSIGIPAESFIHLLVRAFYALKDTWTPILVSIPGLLLIIILSKLLLPTLALNALAISYFLASTLEAIILFLILRKRIQKI